MPRIIKKSRKVARKSDTRIVKSAKRRGYLTNNNLKSLNPISQRYICKMKYAETAYADLSGRYTYNLNSIYDPNRTGTGHQPYGFDTFATMYNRYRVISCSYRILVPSSTVTVQAGVLPANDVTSMTTVAEVKENPRGRYMTQQPGGQLVPLSGKVYIPSLFGRAKSQYMADDRYQAPMSTDPAEAAILNILITSNSDTPIPSQVFQIELVYTVELFDVKTLPQS